MACDTYDCAEAQYAGVYEEGKREPLAPIAHAMRNATLEIVVDKEGNFIAATKISKGDEKTIIPVTEKSSGRTSKGAATTPHPLCDKIDFLKPKNKEGYEAYLEQLGKWKDSSCSHPFLKAIYAYVVSKTISEDIKSVGIEDDDLFVRWRVVGISGEVEACWKNKRLQNCYIAYYMRQANSGYLQEVCMVTGKLERVATQHPNGLINSYIKAKLISSNDNSNFTFRGRFINDKEALTIGYETSQKAHNALHWLIANQGILCGGRSFLCWTPKGKEVPKMVECMMPLGMKSEDRPQIYISNDYQKWMQDILHGWKNHLGDTKNIVTAVFDAATQGRLAVTYYSELATNDFLERITFWDTTCCYMNSKWGIQAPSLYDIARYAFGTYRNDKFEIDEGILKQVMLRLLVCRLEQAPMQADIERAIVNTAQNLQLYDWKTRNKVLFTACAVIKKYKFDHKKEEWTVALEPEKKDRSYQYGRLLAVLEKEERDTYSSEEEGRETNAIRIQSVFVKRPQYASRILIEQIKRAYSQRLSARSKVYYEKLIGEIMEQLATFCDELDKPLEDTYLLGYYMQKNALYTKTKEEEN